MNRAQRSHLHFAAFAVLAALLPYHTHVDPGDGRERLNHIIDAVNDGKTIFYQFYTEAKNEAQPARSETGPFFVAKVAAPFATISPGGGFAYVGSLNEGFPYAITISNHGYNAFVLRYRAGSGGAVATRDLAAAVTYVFRNATTPGCGTEGYSRIAPQRFSWRGNVDGEAASCATHPYHHYRSDECDRPLASPRL